MTKGLSALTNKVDSDQTAMGLPPIMFAVFLIPYHSRFIPEGVAEASQIFLRDAHVLPKLLSNEEHCRRDRW
jgi:hypothetical protein